MEAALGAPLRFRPGTDRRYGNVGSAVAAQVAVRATGTPFPELLRALILEPGGLRTPFARYRRASRAARAMSMALPDPPGWKPPILRAMSVPRCAICSGSGCTSLRAGRASCLRPACG